MMKKFLAGQAAARAAMLLPFLMAGTAAPPAAAQSDWARSAVPVYGPTAVLQGLNEHWTLPHARAFAAEAQALPVAVEARCNAGPATPAAGPALEAARAQWRRSVQAWERLSTVAVGPLVERRSLRQIDFAPTRPALIEKAVRAAPADAAAMERVGTPAKGLPALEWLLWTRPVAPGTPACRYAVEVARDIQREADALAQAFAAQATAAAEHDADGEVDEASVVAGSTEFVNQWVGGVERLRWAQMEKPLRAAAGRAPDWPRAASGGSVASWKAQWEALRGLGLFAGGEAPLAGQGLVPLETWLRSKGRNPEADRLVAAARQVDARLQRIDAKRPPTVLAAAQALAALKRVAEADVAPALEVSLGFSDADGD
ncbi:imelysin family protein [Methylibium petroleiphilum]